MRIASLMCLPPLAGRLACGGIAPRAAALLVALLALAAPAGAADLRVMRTGLGSGTVVSTTPGIACGADCDESYPGSATVTLTPTAAAGSQFAGWSGDCSGTGACTLSMGVARSVRARFDLNPAVPTLADFTPAGIAAYLAANPVVNSAPRFIAALPVDYRWNWILMSRSESLQTGTAEFPRILLPSEDARFIFTVGLTPHSSYPGAHPNAIEYMQWDATEKNFRLHEIVLDTIPAMGGIPARSRGVSVDDVRCSACHSTRNVPNQSSFPGTTGIPPGVVQVKNKPNWDAYDSWAGMLPFNRDRIYQGSVEAAAFRRIFNPWTWRANEPVRSLIEQLELQPPGVPAAHAITRTEGGANDGHVSFTFDAAPPVLTEPAPVGSSAAITTSYAFNAIAGTGPATSVTRGGSFVTLHHSAKPMSDEGRGVDLFDLLAGLDGNLNQQRVADEIVNHRFATGSVPIDVRPVALAITKPGCLTVPLPASLTIDLGFFNARNGMTLAQLITDTRARAQSLPRRKADLQRLTLDRTGDPYLRTGDATGGLIQQYGAATSAGTSTALDRLRQEVFRRPTGGGPDIPDATVMGGIYVDREDYAYNTERVALFRYFLEPLGVSVDKWSTGVRGRSRTYSFADVFSTYADVLTPALEASLTSDPVPGLSPPFGCAALISAVNITLGSLPPPNAVPTFTDVQRIFNRGCIECHGGLNYPPYVNHGTILDLSEDEAPPPGGARLDRSHARAVVHVTASPATSYLYQRITQTNENCPFGMMPCGGPPLSGADVETVRRWILGGAPNTAGDPHIKTVDGINYDFQAAGEFVLLRGENLELQARQTAVATAGPLGPNPHTGLTSCVSVNTAVALRAGGARITYQPSLSGRHDPDGLQLRINGEPARLDARDILLASGGRIVRTSAPGGIQVEAPGGTTIAVTPGWWSHHQIWYLNIEVRHARATQGVMGAIALGNWLPALPDGSLLGPMPRNLDQRYHDLYERFGRPGA